MRGRQDITHTFAGQMREIVGQILSVTSLIQGSRPDGRRGFRITGFTGDPAARRSYQQPPAESRTAVRYRADQVTSASCAGLHCSR